MKRFLKWILLTLLGLLLLASITFFWLSNSESGLRWATGLVPETLSVQTINGNLSDFSFTGLEVSAAGTNTKIASGSLQWSLSELLSRHVSVENLQLNGVRVALPPPVEPTQEPYVPWQGLTLPIAITAQKLVLDDLVVTQNEQELVAIDTIETQLSLLDSRLKLDYLTVVMDDNKISAEGKINLRARPGDKVRLVHAVDWQLPDQQIRTSGEISGTWETLQIEQSLSSPLVASTSIELRNALTQTLSWSGSIETDDAPPQQLGEQTIDIGAGSFDTSGEFSPGDGLPSLIATLEGSIKGGNDVLSRWALNTDVAFHRDNLAIKSLTVEQLSGERPGSLTVNGSINGVSKFLEQEPSGNDTAIADLSGRWNELGWPLSTPTDVVSAGEFSFNGSPQDFTVKAKVKGESYGKPFNGDFVVNARDADYNISAATLRSGQSTAKVSGSIGDRLALKWNVLSPDLDEFWPGLGGSLNSQGEIAGTATAPEFDATAKADQITYLDYQLDGLDIVAKGSLGSLAKPLKVQAEATQLSQASRKLAQNVNIDLTGSAEKFKLAINTQLLDATDLQVRADGGVSDNGWQARLLEFDLNDPTYKRWQLQEAVSANGEGSSLHVDRTCLVNSTQSVCVQADANDQSLKASGTISELELANLNPALSLYDSRLTGLLNGKFNYVKQTSQNTAEFQAEFESKDAQATVSRATETGAVTQDISIRSIKLNADQLTEFNATVSATLENGDEVSAELAVAAPVESADFMSAKLTGQINGEFKDLSALPIPEEALKIAQGTLGIDTALGGSLSAPSIVMKTQLSDTQAEVPLLGLNLKDINIQAVSEDQQVIVLTGQLTSGEGTLALNGRLDFAKLDKPQIKLSLRGENLQLMETPEINVLGSLDTQISLINDLLDVSGQVSLAAAELDFQPPEDAIMVSEDVIFEGQGVEKKGGLQQQIKLSIDLGDDMHVRAQGFDGYLTGRLTVLQEPGGILRGKGQVDIKKGRYDAYNQKLSIDRGQLIFSGGSIDDPSLDLKAQKTVDEIIAGVNVTGQASAPLLRLYSTPSMQDQDILSVLIFGKPLGQLGSSDGLTLLKIANSLRGDGQSGVTKLTERIQDSLGLTNLELQLSGDAPSIMAGKQFFSKLYIGYGYGLLDAAQSLILRYKLSTAWSVNADLGADSGADLRYQIER